MIAAKQTTPAPYGPRDAGAIMTLDEFEAADYELGYRYELIHGVLIVKKTAWKAAPRVRRHGRASVFG